MQNVDLFLISIFGADVILTLHMRYVADMNDNVYLQSMCNGLDVVIPSVKTQGFDSPLEFGIGIHRRVTGVIPYEV